MKKLSINDFTAMEIIDLSNRLEAAETLPFYNGGGNNKKKSKHDTLMNLMNEAFGICWWDNEVYNAFFNEYVTKVFDIISGMTEGYVSAIEI